MAARAEVEGMEAHEAQSAAAVASVEPQPPALKAGWAKVVKAGAPTSSAEPQPEGAAREAKHDDADAANARGLEQGGAHAHA